MPRDFRRSSHVMCGNSVYLLCPCLLRRYGYSATFCGHTEVVLTRSTPGKNFIAAFCALRILMAVSRNPFFCAPFVAQHKHFLALPTIMHVIALRKAAVPDYPGRVAGGSPPSSAG